MKRYSLVLFLAMVIMACENDTEPDGLVESSEIEYLVFGRFSSGMGGGDSQMFRVTRTDFTQEVVEPFFARLDYEYNPEITMTDADRNNAQQLIDLLPTELVDSPKDTYGCPDCYDQGGFYLEFGNEAERKKMLLDPDDSDDQSTEIVAYKEAIATLLLLWRD